jgi:hypothetical protein
VEIATTAGRAQRGISQSKPNPILLCNGVLLVSPFSHIFHVETDAKKTQPANLLVNISSRIPRV